jgi:hypothetical protein
MKRLLGVVVLALGAAATAQANHSLPCKAYVQSFGVKAITHPPTKKCVMAVYETWLDCLIKAYDGPYGHPVGTTCYKQRQTVIYGLTYTKEMSRIEKRNQLIDLEGTLIDLCDYSSIYCSEADKVSREIRKLQR